MFNCMVKCAAFYGINVRERSTNKDRSIFKGDSKTMLVEHIEHTPLNKVSIIHIYFKFTNSPSVIFHPLSWNLKNENIVNNIIVKHLTFMESSIALVKTFASSFQKFLHF